MEKETVENHFRFEIHQIYWVLFVLFYVGREIQSDFSCKLIIIVESISVCSVHVLYETKYDQTGM